MGEFARAGPEHVDAAYRAARDALAGWRRTPAIQRGEILDRAAQLLAERTEDLATAFTREEGKTIAETRVEVARGAQILRYYAGETASPAARSIRAASPAASCTRCASRWAWSA